MMLTQQHDRLSRSIRTILSIASIAVLLAIPSPVYAQEQRPSFAVDVAKHVALDPTTYVPAILGYDATTRDWDSSQAFFRNGYVEHNPQFTISGLPNDQPLSYQAGRHQILSGMFTNLEISVANNVADQVFERLLTDRYPNHRKLIHALGWVERSAFASAFAYAISAKHYQQWQQNQQMALQLGIK
jgi:hypothetical protein